MRISARGDYAVRAALELAAHTGELLRSEEISNAQDIPPSFLGRILADLTGAGLIFSQRGARGGYRLARPATEISIADVIRAVEGPIVYVRGDRPDAIEYHGAATALPLVWLHLREAVRSVLDVTTLAQVIDDDADTVSAGKG